VVSADWSTLHDRAPFTLLFLDAREPKDAGVDAVVDLVGQGGIVVLDDFTPCESWPPMFAGRVDSLREEWLSDERFAAVEVMIAPDASAVIATRR
jgi:predicted O-methyltransferase YrrM